MTVVIDGYKRQVYPIINYVRFEITSLLLYLVQIMYTRISHDFLQLMRASAKRELYCPTFYRVNLVVWPAYRQVRDWAIGIRLEDIIGGSSFIV